MTVAPRINVPVPDRAPRDPDPYPTPNPDPTLTVHNTLTPTNPGSLALNPTALPLLCLRACSRRREVTPLGQATRCAAS